MPDALQIIDDQEKAIDILYKAHKALLGLARTQAKELQARTADDDEWLRMPSGKQKCQILGCSHGKIRMLIKAGSIRRKRAIGTTFYSGSDARKLLKDTPKQET